MNSSKFLLYNLLKYTNFRIYHLENHLYRKDRSPNGTSWIIHHHESIFIQIRKFVIFWALNFISIGKKSFLFNGSSWNLSKDWVQGLIEIILQVIVMEWFCHFVHYMYAHINSIYFQFQSLKIILIMIGRWSPSSQLLYNDLRFRPN